MSLIAYLPPKSVSHGHGARARNPRKAWNAIQQFLKNHTTSTIRPTLKLTSYGESKWTDSAIVEEVRRQAAEYFGPATSDSGMFRFWDLPPDRLEEALEFVFADANRPKQAVGPVTLYVAYSFSWKSFENLSVPHHLFERGNWLGINVEGHRVFIQPTFLFTQPSQKSEFLERLRMLEASMPFSPRDDYYYHVVAKARGGEKLAKLGSGWKNA